MELSNLTLQEFETHRGTCPLEIGRFQFVRNQVSELIGPLKIYRIWTENDNPREIHLSNLGEDSSTSIHGPIKIQLGSDNLLYTENNGIFYSITKVN